MNQRGGTLSRESLTDRQLLSAYAEGRDMGCLGIFLSRHQDPLLRFAAGLVGDREAAQDVVQETFLEVIKKPRRLLEVDSCRNWLLRVTRNVGVTHLRKAARDRRNVQHLAGAPPASPDEALEAADERERVRRAIQALAPQHREVLLLKIEHDKSYAEIAEITGLTVSNVGYRLHEAMKAISKRLRKKDEVS